MMKIESETLEEIRKFIPEASPEIEPHLVGRPVTFLSLEFSPSPAG